MECSINKELSQNNYNIMLNENLNFIFNVNNTSKTADTEKNEANQYGNIDEKALRMMSKMGYQSGTGLGRNNQGILEPVKLQTNFGRLGFGHFINELEPVNVNAVYTQENLLVEEKAYWLVSCDADEIDKNFLYLENEIFSDWIKVGPRKSSIADETKYCDPILLQEVLKAKEVFDELDPLELCKARSRANPFETLKSAFFMNRASLKMANIDAATDFMFTDIDRQEEHRQSSNPYYFADICAGPGGFSEYIFWRKRWAFKGFGMTLRGEHDFKVHESTCASSETFEAMYGARNDGDVYYPENISDFCSKVRNYTAGLGVHFVMADGGFSVEGQENIQEVLSRQIYVCQCLIALKILRTSGHFVVKLFDLFTPFSVGLIYLMYRCFHKIAILKPNSSRPANSERYLICSKLKNDQETAVIREYVEKIVQILFEIRTDNEKEVELDINEIVPERIIHSDIIFVHYIKESNNRLAKRQIQGLMKLSLFCRDPALFEPRQDELRTKCLAYWRVPDRLKVPLPHISVNDLFNKYVYDPSFLFSFAKELTHKQELNEILEEPEDWHFAFAATGKRGNMCNVYTGLGRNKVYRYQGNRWIKFTKVELVRGTILFGEMVKESFEVELSNKRCLHVIDALRLGDISLADLPYPERLELINVYCQAVTKESRSDLIRIRVKPAFPFLQFKKFNLPALSITGEWLLPEIPTNYQFKNCNYVANSLLFIKTDLSQTFGSLILSRCLIHLPNSLEMLSKTEHEEYSLWEAVMKNLEPK